MSLEVSRDLLWAGQEGAEWGFELLSTCELEVEAGVLGSGKHRLKLLLPKSRQLQSELPAMDGRGEGGVSEEPTKAPWRERVSIS